jgi:hypothetical protein
MKYATLLACALILLLPSCASHSDTAQDDQSSPIAAYRVAQKAAGVINTAQTFGDLF